MSQGFTRGVPIDTDPNLSLDSDLVVPSQKAIKDYVDTGLNTKQDTITLTTTGTSGAATLTGATLNIPQYGGGSVTPSALTKTDDTNVTLTLGGTPSTALLQATSLTLGWTGRLATSRVFSVSTARLLGRSTAGTGDIEELSAIPNGITATTQLQIDNSTKIATTAFVATAVAAPQTGSNLYLFYNY